MRSRYRVAVCGVLIAAACSTGALYPPAGIPVTGAWGGNHIGLMLTETGGRIEYDCGSGSIDEPLRVDASGRFVVSGFHYPGHGGPIRIDEPVDSVPARYSGTILDNMMKLEVHLPSDSIGPYTLIKGRDARVFKCL